jgi:hypothetical protein
MKYKKFREENGVMKIQGESKLLKFILSRKTKKIGKAMIKKGYLPNDKKIQGSCIVEFSFKVNDNN